MMESLDDYLDRKLRVMQREYIRALNKDLARQETEGLFVRNVIVIQEKFLSEVRAELEAAHPKGEALDAMLAGFVDTFIQSALAHNRTSCAISNFPDEHTPAKDVINEAIGRCYQMNQDFLSTLEAS
ncbi:MAG: hypothetical protein MI976_23345, partial [Pseudomonadales bacterium]|nr:hypothetical protein [Pseudomonadales bacterium]